MIDIIILFVDHVDMCLQDNRLAVFVAFGSRFIDHDIPDGILFVFQTMFFCEITDIIADCLFIA